MVDASNEDATQSSDICPKWSPFLPQPFDPFVVPRNPLVGCRNGYQRQVTILGANSRDKSLAYLIDFYSLLTSTVEVEPGYQIMMPPHAAFGSSAFASHLYHLTVEGDRRLVAVEVQSDTKPDQLLEVLYSLVRFAPDIFLIEDLADESLFPHAELRRLMFGGFHFGSTVVAENKVEMFKMVETGLRLTKDECDFLLNFGTEQRAIRMQLFFEGKPVIEEFIEWIRPRVTGDKI